MQIEKLFSKPIDRTIEGVIKADDDAYLFEEIDEYVVTDEVSRCLDEFLDYYNDFKSVNGAWISGFFGSGKSHLLKILSMILEDRKLMGDLSSAELFLEKFDGDALLKGAMEKALSIPSKSILFNIDQKSDQSDAVLPVFVKVFNEMRGYYGTVPSIARFEYDLDKKGQYSTFKEAFLNISGDTWESQRDAIWLSPEVFAQALASVSDISEEEASKVLDRYESNYKISIEDFALEVEDYIKSKPSNFRLNFFVDEVGQYVADNVKLMTSLQTIAESLNTKCRGKAWIFVTSQGDMEAVVGQWEGEQGNDFSKIQDRFKCRMKLTSANVEEVIRKRLLDKKKDVKTSLRFIYRDQKENYRTLFEFGEGSRNYRGFKGEDHFVDIYPFLPYQFDLFQTAIRNLSSHNAFEGKHRSVGERSMLGVFQMAGRNIGKQEIGRIASFDLFYDGIQKALVSQLQNDINQAEKNIVSSRLAVRILKALLLVKYVKEFKATARNLSILLIETFDTKPSEHEKEVKEALNMLEANTYIQRNGDVYEFLTDEEKDIESEIKDTDIDQSEINGLFADIVFKDILSKLQKVRYKEKKQDYPLAKKLDGTLASKDYELSINVVSQLNDNYGNMEAIMMDSLKGGELTVILPEDRRIVDDLNLYRKTQKYSDLNFGKISKKSVENILNIKIEQNQRRKEDLRAGINSLITKASFMVCGTGIETGSSDDAESRVNSALQQLVAITYPNMRMIKSTFKEEDIAKILTEKQDDIFINSGETMTEAEVELFSEITRMKGLGQRTTLNGLIERFGKAPYGWWQSAVLCVLAYLYVRGKVDIKQDSNFLNARDLSSALGNSRNFGNILVEPRIEYAQKDIKRLEELHHELFNESNNGMEAKDTGEKFRDRLREEVKHLDEKVIVQSSEYPFKDAIRTARDLFASYTGKEYNYYITNIDEFEDALLDSKEDVIDPIKKFMNGDKKKIYDDIKSFLDRQTANYPYLDQVELKKLEDLEAEKKVYKGNLIQQGKVSLDRLRHDLMELIKEERHKALGSIEETVLKIRSDVNYPGLPVDKKAVVENSIESPRKRVNESHLIPVIQQIASDFEGNKYCDILNFMSQATAEVPIPTPPGGEVIRVHEPVPKPKTIIGRKDISVPFSKNCIETEADLELYLENVKSEFLKKLNCNMRIIL